MFVSGLARNRNNPRLSGFEIRSRILIGGRLCGSNTLLLLLLLAGLQVGLLHDYDARAHAGAVTPTHALAWLTLVALLFSNAMWHLKGTLRMKRYSPGLITGLGLYVPLTLFGYIYFVGTHKASWPIALLALAIGGSYHFWAGMMHRRRARRWAARTNSN